MSYDHTQPIVPWWKMTAKSEGLANWNKSIKPNAHDFKPFREMNLWNEHKESFLIALEAQNLTHLVEKNPTIHDDDFDSAQRKFPFKVMQDDFSHHEAKSIVKKCTKDKDTERTWEELCNFHDSSIAAAMHADVLMTHLADVKLHKANWNRGQGEFVNHCKIQKNKFNEIAPDSQMSDPHAAQRGCHTPSSVHCAKSYRPFELFVNENCKLQNEAKMNVMFERGSARDPLALSSLC